MRWAFPAALVVHGLIHLAGATKAFGVAELPQLAPISLGMGVIWLTASLLMLGTAASFIAAPRAFWVIGLGAIVLSQIAVATSWHDARFGTLGNVLLLAGAVYGFVTFGPTSLRAQYRRAVTKELTPPVRSQAVSEDDLAPLPAPVQRYLRWAGAVGQPRVTNYRLRLRGRIRSGANAPWMPFEAEQQSFVDPPARLFFMHASMKRLPVDAYHDLLEGHARMRVRVGGVVTLVDASGPVMDRSEMVTLLNDMCLLAPPTLIDSRIGWEPIDERSARAHFTSGAHTISAQLRFDREGRLVDFVSDDRAQLSEDGKHFTRLRFTTPVTDYRRFGPYLLAGRAEAHWHPASGEFAYGEFEVVDARFNVAAPRSERRAAAAELHP